MNVKRVREEIHNQTTDLAILEFDSLLMSRLVYESLVTQFNASQSRGVIRISITLSDGDVTGSLSIKLVETYIKFDQASSSYTEDVRAALMSAALEAAEEAEARWEPLVPVVKELLKNIYDKIEEADEKTASITGKFEGHLRDGRHRVASRLERRHSLPAVRKEPSTKGENHDVVISMLEQRSIQQEERIELLSTQLRSLEENVQRLRKPVRPGGLSRFWRKNGHRPPEEPELPF